MKEGLERERERKGERKEERIYKSVLATGPFSGEGNRLRKRKRGRGSLPRSRVEKKGEPITFESTFHILFLLISQSSFIN